MPGILQARTNLLNSALLIPQKRKVKVKFLRCDRLFETPWTVANQAPLSMEFSSPEYWSGLPLPSPGDLPNPGIEPRSPILQADALLSEPPGKPKPSFALRSFSLFSSALSSFAILSSALLSSLSMLLLLLSRFSRV